MINVLARIPKIFKQSLIGSHSDRIQEDKNVERNVQNVLK